LTSYQYINLFTRLACTHRVHVGGERGIARKYRRSCGTTKSTQILLATQRQQWWNTNSKTTKELLQLVTVIQAR